MNFENFMRRIPAHLRTLLSHFTAKVSDWQVYLQIECESVEQAVKVEAHIKRMKSRKYLFDLKAYPTLVEKLKSRYSV